MDKEVTKAHEKRPRSSKTVLAEAVLGYADRTSAHGVNYASWDGSGHICEKILWAVICVVFSCLAIALTWRAYADWQQNPVITTILTTGKLILVKCKITSHDDQYHIQGKGCEILNFQL